MALASETPDPFNAETNFTVVAEFSEPVAGFDDTCVSLENGTCSVSASDNSPNTYVIAVTPAADGRVSVSIAAGVVKDSAGNGNVASETIIDRVCDITRPTVTRLSCDTPDVFNAGETFEISVTFSEEVSEFMASRVIVDNERGTVTEVSGSGTQWTVVITPAAEDQITVSIAENAARDAAGNGSVAPSSSIAKIYDNTKPSVPEISGKPEAETSVGAFSMTATSTDANEPITYTWTWTYEGGSETSYGAVFAGTAKTGQNKISVYAEDPALNTSDPCEYSWVYTPPQPEDVDFGGGVTVAIDAETGATNGVAFTALDFRPGAQSTFSLSGFDSTAESITTLTMWFEVSETLTGSRWYERVEATATYDTATRILTVTLPAGATMNGAGAYDTYFIHGIYNEDPSAEADPSVE